MIVTVLAVFHAVSAILGAVSAIPLRGEASDREWGGVLERPLWGVIDIKIFEDLELLKNLWILNIDDGDKHDNSIDNMH